jgi:hypothetical protein
MQAIGYVTMLHAERERNRPTLAYQRWLERIPHIYQVEMLNDPKRTPPSLETDPNRLGTLRHYLSLMPMAQEAHKPIFFLKPADGIIGSHFYAVRSAYQDFETLAQNIYSQLNIL